MSTNNQQGGDADVSNKLSSQQSHKNDSSIIFGSNRAVIIFGFLVILLSISVPFTSIFREQQQQQQLDDPPSPSTSPPSLQVAIFGGTGNQGGSAIDYLISNGNILEKNIRVLTRNSTSKSSQELLSKHPSIILIEGDSTDSIALDTLLSGVDAVFAITFSTLNPDMEFQTGISIGKALLKHKDTISTFVFSGGMRTGIQGLDIKADIEDSLIQTLSNAIPCQVYLHTSFFYENLVLKGPSLRVSQARFASSSSSSPSYDFRTPLPAHLSVPMVSSEDIGRAAAFVIQQTHPSSSSSSSSTWCNSKSSKVQRVPLIGDTVSGPTFASNFSKFSGLPSRYESIPLEVMTGLDPKDLQRLQSMYDWYATGDGVTRGLAGLEKTQTIFPSGLIRTMPVWMKEVGSDWILDLLRKHQQY